jgi:hypothetical protein
MPLILPKSVILLIPRTASTWVRQAVRNGGIRYREFGPKHSTALPPNAPAFKACFLREPSAWLRSRWVLGPWEDELTQFWNIDFEKFRAAVSDGMVQMYFGKYTQGCSFVGKGESIADDLVQCLRLAGEDFDETSLRDTPRVNESPKTGDPIPETFWQMRRDELGKLPDDITGRLPIDLLPKLPPNRLEALPPTVLAEMVRHTTRAALEAAGSAAAGLKR